MLTDPAETGAVTIALPQDVQARGLRLARALLRAARLGDRAPAAGDGPRSRERSSCSAARERPLIVAGGGVHYSEAWDALAEFAELLGIPVGETSAGKGAFRGRPALRSAASA